MGELMGLSIFCHPYSTSFGYPYTQTLTLTSSTTSSGSDEIGGSGSPPSLSSKSKLINGLWANFFFFFFFSFLLFYVLGQTWTLVSSLILIVLIYITDIRRPWFQSYHVQRDNGYMTHVVRYRTTYIQSLFWANRFWAESGKP